MAANELLERLNAQNNYHTQFAQAKQLAEQIFHQTPPATIQIMSTDQRYFVDHGIDHVNRIISKLNALNLLLVQPLNLAESFVLVVAAYYHDISMFIGRRAGETPEHVRDNHNTISADLIQSFVDRGLIIINQEELDLIKDVIRAHRQVDLAEITECARIDDQSIRTRLLGAFLRIADACDCNRARTPKVVFDLYFNQIPEGSRGFWQLNPLVTDVTIERNRASVILSANFNGSVKDKIEKCRIANYLVKEINSELATVEDTFNRNNVSLFRAEVRDFHSGKIIDLTDMPFAEKTATIALISNSNAVEKLAQIIGKYVANNAQSLPLVVEFRPSEGPLFANPEIKVDINRIDDLKTEVQTDLGGDLWGFSIIERIVTLRGIVT
jgi:hypothetical protein